MCTSLTPQCDAQRGVWLHGMMHTVESDCTVGCTPQSFFETFVFLTLQCVWCTQQRFSKFCISQLNKKEFENVLVFLSGAQMGSNHEKKICQIISGRFPFKQKTRVENLVTLSLANVTKIRKSSYHFTLFCFFSGEFRLVRGFQFCHIEAWNPSCNSVTVTGKVSYRAHWFLSKIGSKNNNPLFKHQFFNSFSALDF